METRRFTVQVRGMKVTDWQRDGKASIYLYIHLFREQK
jgi:hypothetical protein